MEFENVIDLLKQFDYHGVVEDQHLTVNCLNGTMLRDHDIGYIDTRKIILKASVLGFIRVVGITSENKVYFVLTKAGKETLKLFTGL